MKLNSVVATLVLAAAPCAVLVAGSQAGHAAQADAPKPVKMSLPQARQTVDMLNDLYVNAVVVTHSTYVKDRATPAAAIMARKVFTAMKEKGWPETRWLATGQPFNPDASPKDAFEKEAVAALKQGKPRFERVENGQLRVVTLIPLVDKSCQMCHTQVKVGDPVGGLAYRVDLSGAK
jgi:hypothetical protein